MKTTIEIDASVLEAARQRARIEGKTLDALLEGALRAQLGRKDLEPAAWAAPVSREVIYESTYWDTLEALANANRRLGEREENA